MKNFKILDWDSDFFGFPVASVLYHNNNHNKTLKTLRSEGIVLVYWQVETTNYEFAIFAKTNNGILIDKKTTYSINYSSSNISLPINTEYYNCTEPNAELLKLAVQCGAYSRFHVDPKITNNKFEELYRLWMVQSVKRKMADDVIVYKLKDRIVGVVTVYLQNGVGNIGLIGVDEQFRGQGIGRELIIATKAYFSKKKIEHIDVITQGMNRQACALYENTGFSISSQTDFYHFWLK